MALARCCTSTEQTHDLLPKDLTYNTTLGTQGSCGRQGQAEQVVKGAPAAAQSFSRIREPFHHPGESTRERLEISLGIQGAPVIPVDLFCHSTERSNDTILSFPDGAGNTNAMCLDTTVLQPPSAILLLQDLEIPDPCSKQPVIWFLMVSQHWIFQKTEPFYLTLLSIIIQVLGTSAT